MANQEHKPFVPPVPRDHDDLTFSEMVPISSKKISLIKSPFFLVIMLTALMVPYVFGLWIGIYGPTGTDQERLRSVARLGLAATFFIAVIIQFMVYLYVRPRRSIWIYFIPFAIVFAMLYSSVVLQVFIYVFREILPGDVFGMLQEARRTGVPATFVQTFIAHLFGAGLMEELLKATPILLGAFLTVSALKNPAHANNPVYRYMHVQGPLDGALMGIFAGGAFVVFETGLDYVPNQILPVLQSGGNVGAAIGQAYGLLFPRVFGGLVGHMAYSGVFGYFIGLAVIRPKARWKLLAIGYGTATLLHTLWNSTPVININLQYVVSIATALALAAALLKARQMEAASGQHQAVDTQGSIVVERLPTASGAMPLAPAMAPAAPMQAPPPLQAPPPMPQGAPPAVAAAPQAAAADILVLSIDGMQLPLRGGGRIDLGAEPALGGRGAGVIGSIIPHPTRANVLGLRNEGPGPWTAKLRDGTLQTIANDQSIRLAAGVAIQFTDSLQGAVEKIG